MNKVAIILGIERELFDAQTGVHLRRWAIGVTKNPENLRKSFEGRNRGERWKQWEADGEEIARSIQELYLNRGMQSASPETPEDFTEELQARTEADGSTYVFIFCSAKK